MSKRPSADALELAAWQLEQHADSLKHVAKWLRAQAKAKIAVVLAREQVRAAEAGLSQEGTLDRLMTLEEVAKQCRTSVSTIRHWIRTKRLRSLRPGRRRMVYLAEVVKLLEAS
jgi:excisionase family DNA binding protein